MNIEYTQLIIINILQVIKMNCIVQFFQQQNISASLLLSRLSGRRPLNRQFFCYQQFLLLYDVSHVSLCPNLFVWANKRVAGESQTANRSLDTLTVTNTLIIIFATDGLEQTVIGMLACHTTMGNTVKDLVGSCYISHN